ncbi:hypothetical protein [Tessaracoccus sp. G1721]
MNCGRRAVLLALALTGCGLDPTISGSMPPAPEPAPEPTQAPEVALAAVSVAGLAGEIEAARSAADPPAGYPAWADAAGAALGGILERLRAVDPVAGGEPAFQEEAPPPSTPGSFADAEASIAAASAAAEAPLREAALAAQGQPLRLLLASAACTARSLAAVATPSVEGDSSPRHFQGTTVAASLPIALSHVWALIYGLGVGLGRLDDDDPLAALGAARLAAAKELRNELRDALPGSPPTQPAAFDLPTPMSTSDEIRAGWGGLEVSVLEGLGRVVAAGGPGVERWLDLMIAQTDDVAAVGQPLTRWPGWA